MHNYKVVRLQAHCAYDFGQYYSLLGLSVGATETGFEVATNFELGSVPVHIFSASSGHFRMYNNYIHSMML